MAKIKPNGNCFFRSIALAVTGSQEYHNKIRLLITTYMIQNFSHPKLSCLLPPNEPMECYVQRSGMQVLGTWATDSNSLFAPNVYIIYVYGQCGKWQKHLPDQVRDDPHQDECIYHFETVKKMYNMLTYLSHINPFVIVCINVHIHPRALGKAGNKLQYYITQDNSLAIKTAVLHHAHIHVDTVDRLSCHNAKKKKKHSYIEQLKCKELFPTS